MRFGKEQICPMSRWRFILVALLDVFLPHGKPGDRWRGAVMKPLFKRCGKNFCMKKGAFFVNPKIVSIGDNVYVGNYVNVGAGGAVVIEDEVILGPMCVILAQNHSARNGSYRFGRPSPGEVRIGIGSWIGAHAVLLPGANVGKSCLIGAGVQIRSNVSDGTIVMDTSPIRHVPLILEEGLLE